MAIPDTGALTVVQPITLVGYGLLLIVYPAILGFVVARISRVPILWGIAVLTAVGCIAIGSDLTKYGVSWIENPFPHILKYWFILFSTSAVSFGVGVAVKWLYRRFNRSR